MKIVDKRPVHWFKVPMESVDARKLALLGGLAMDRLRTPTSPASTPVSEASETEQLRRM